MGDRIEFSANGITIHVCKTKYRDNDWAVVFASTDVAGNGLSREDAILAAQAVIASGASSIRDMRAAAASR